MIGKKPSNNRRSTRSPVTPFEAKGELITDDGAHSDAVLIWNISDTGLCLWATAKFRQGDEVSVRISHPTAVEMRCVVRWVRSIPDRSGFLLGLEALTNQEALAELYDRVAGTSTRDAGWALAEGAEIA
jgi:PilZ domain